MKWLQRVTFLKYHFVCVNSNLGKRPREGPKGKGIGFGLIDRRLTKPNMFSIKLLKLENKCYLSKIWEELVANCASEDASVIAQMLPERRVLDKDLLAFGADPFLDVAI